MQLQSLAAFQRILLTSGLGALACASWSRAPASGAGAFLAASTSRAVVGAEASPGARPVLLAFSCTGRSSYLVDYFRLLRGERLEHSAGLRHVNQQGCGERWGLFWHNAATAGHLLQRCALMCQSETSLIMGQAC